MAENRMQNRLQKLGVALLTLLLMPLVAGLYGVLHDQLTYTICPEYYSKFKFLQFELIEDVQHQPANPRVAVAMIGFLATWWTGIFIGVGLGLTGLIHRTAQQMYKAVLKSVWVVLMVAFSTGLIGLLLGIFVFATPQNNAYVPGDVIESSHFIAVGSMHNFSYLGGLLGLMAGIIYHIILKVRWARPLSGND